MKPVVKEISIILLVSIAVLLVFGILLYDYIPLNHVVPTISEYKVPEQVKEQLKEIATEDTSDIILTYEISESDLGVYENTKSYDKGKVNPFSTYSSGQADNATNDTSGQQSTTQNNNGNTSNSSQNTNTFYEDNRN